MLLKKYLLPRVEIQFPVRDLVWSVDGLIKRAHFEIR